MSASLNTYKEKIKTLESSIPGISNNFRFYLKKALKYSDAAVILNDDIDIPADEVVLIEDFIDLSIKKLLNCMPAKT